MPPRPRWALWWLMMTTMMTKVATTKIDNGFLEIRYGDRKLIGRRDAMEEWSSSL
jgi:hypothetical protein